MFYVYYVSMVLWWNKDLWPFLQQCFLTSYLYGIRWLYLPVCFRRNNALSKSISLYISSDCVQSAPPSMCYGHVLKLSSRLHNAYHSSFDVYRYLKFLDGYTLTLWLTGHFHQILECLFSSSAAFISHALKCCSAIDVDVGLNLYNATCIFVATQHPMYF